MNNPVSLLDPSGLEIAWDSHMSQEDQDQIEEFFQASKTLRKIWKEMKESKYKITMSFTHTKLAKDNNPNNLPVDFCRVFPLNFSNARNGIGSDAYMFFHKNSMNLNYEWGKDGCYYKAQAAIMGHEGEHALGIINGSLIIFKTSTGLELEEIRSMKTENIIRKELGIKHSDTYTDSKGTVFQLPKGEPVPFVPILMPE